MKRIYLSPPHLDGRERELLLQAYDSNWITTLGPHVDAFEQEMTKLFHFVSGVTHKQSEWLKHKGQRNQINQKDKLNQKA